MNKPIQPRVLLARLRALLRRPQTSDVQTAEIHDLTFGGLHIALLSRTVVWRGKAVELSNTEFKMLVVLAESAGQVLSRDAIFRKLRGVEFDGMDRRIDNLVSRLRRYFDDIDAEKIKTVWGEGYLFSPTGWD